MKKSIIASFMMIAAAGTMVFAASKTKGKITASTAKDSAAIVEDITTFQAFLDEAVPQADIDKIVNAGVNAQSAMNKQPWHFSVVTSKEVFDEITNGMKMPKAAPKGDTAAPAGAPAGAPADMPAAPSGMPAAPAGSSSGAKAAIGDSPLVIIISATDGNELDAGLATETMAIEAALLGYGTKIISSPTMVLNGTDKAKYQKLLGIPTDMSVKAVLLVGKYDENNLDAVSGATTRKDKSEVVTYVK